MGKLTFDISVSLDGFIAGLNPTLEERSGRAATGSTLRYRVVR